MRENQKDQTSYQAIYVGRDQATHTSPRFATEEAAQEYLATVIIGSGVIVRIFANGDMLPVGASNSNGDYFRYADAQS